MCIKNLSYIVSKAVVCFSTSHFKGRLFADAVVCIATNHLRRKIFFLIAVLFSTTSLYAQRWISDTSSPDAFDISSSPVYADAADFILVHRAVNFLRKDIETVTGKKPELTAKLPAFAKVLL